MIEILCSGNVHSGKKLFVTFPKLAGCCCGVSRLSPVVRQFGTFTNKTPGSLNRHLQENHMNKPPNPQSHD
jgi:hypothetical protein